MDQSGSKSVCNYLSLNYLPVRLVNIPLLTFILFIYSSIVCYSQAPIPLVSPASVELKLQNKNIATEVGIKRVGTATFVGFQSIKNFEISNKADKTKKMLFSIKPFPDVDSIVFSLGTPQKSDGENTVWYGSLQPPSEGGVIQNFAVNQSGQAG